MSRGPHRNGNEVTRCCRLQILLIYSSCQKAQLLFLFSPKAAELNRAHCHFSGGAFRVRRQRVSHLLWRLSCSCLSYILIEAPPLFFSRCVSQKPIETHQTSGDDGPPTIKRRKPSPGPFIIVKDEPEDDLSYVRRSISLH